MDLAFINNSYCNILKLFLSEKEANQLYAQQLLNEVTDELSNSINQNFNNIISYGWTLSFLNVNKYININTDLYLEDFDDHVYKVTMQELSIEDFNIDILLDLINYLIIRLKDKNPNEEFYRNFIHSECIKLIINKLDCYLDLCISNKKLTKEQIYNCSRILLKYSYCLDFIDIRKTSDSLINHIIFFITYFNNNLNKIHLYHNEISFIVLATINRNHKILFKSLYKIHKFYFSQEKNIPFKKKLKSCVNNHDLIFILTNTSTKQYH